ncbi:protein mo25 [Citrus sinensis]|nr:protein mo25 [Citrus sinensis]
MSFSFFKPSRPKTPLEVVKATKVSLMALDIKTVVEVKALEKAMEEIEKNFVTMRCMLSGDGEVEPNADQVLQLATEVCKEDVLILLVHKLPILGWEARKDLVHCWSILLKQKVDSTYCCVQFIENHFELLDFLVVCYDNKEVALHCGIMLRECIKFPSLARYILESASFELFFKFVELPTFDVASDAFSTFKDLLTKHLTVVSEYLTAHYDEFFDLYEKLLTSSNYVTRRQSLKVFVANPNKPHEVKVILAKNHEKLLELLRNLSVGKGADDDQFEEEKELIMKEIERVSGLPNHDC